MGDLFKEWRGSYYGAKVDLTAVANINNGNAQGAVHGRVVGMGNGRSLRQPKAGAVHRVLWCGRMGCAVIRARELGSTGGREGGL